MKRIFSVIFILCVLYNTVLSQATPGKMLTLQQCVEAGIENNLQVQQSGLQMQADEINWKQAKLNLLPDLNGFANHGANQGRSIDPFTNSYINQQVNYANYGLSSGVTLFNGFFLQNTIKQNKLAFEASKMDWQQQKDFITMSVILAYLQVLNNEDILEQIKNQTTLSQKQVERLDILNKEGAISPSDLYDLKGQYASDQLSIINAQNNLESSKLSLCQLMNIPYDKNMGLEKIDVNSVPLKYENDPAGIYQTALTQFPLIKTAELRTLSAEKGVLVARGALFPTLSLNGSINTNYSNAATSSTFLNTTDVVSNDYVVVNGSPSPVIKKQNNFSTDKIDYTDQIKNNRFSSVSLNLRIPIFNSWQARNRIKLAKINLKNFEQIEKTTKTELQQNIEQAYINMTSAYDRFKTTMEQVAAFQESFRAAEIRFNEGVGNSIDYLTVKNNLDRASINMIIAKYDYVLRIKILDYYQGRALW